MGLAIIIIIGHHNDSLLLSNSREDCIINVSDTVNLLDSIVFYIHHNELVLKPMQRKNILVSLMALSL